MTAPRLPLWLKIAYTAFVAVLVPFYWRTYGPVNFLWFCDVALLVTLPALWLESPFLSSVQGVAMPAPQLCWAAESAAHLPVMHPRGLPDLLLHPSCPAFLLG